MSASPPPGATPGTLGRLLGKHVSLCVTGSIAAYKSALLLRLLRKEGASVDVVLSRNAEQFVGRATFAGLNQKPPYSDLFDPYQGGELHIELAKKSDLVLIAPASADLLARLAGGRADDLIGALALSARTPLLVAPAMHPDMWAHPATQRNVKQLVADGLRLVGPVHGEVASGDTGLGRMAEPETIIAFAIAALTEQTLRGKHLVVSAGPTAEDLDPVRSLTNRSSGKMGFSIAERAKAHGARVTLVAGPVALPTPPGVQRIDVRSALEMRAALLQTLKQDLSGADALIMAAAVADYRPAHPSSAKLKRTEDALTLELLPNPDLIAELGALRQGNYPVLVAFALETTHDEALIEAARGKLARKKVDLVVANPADESIGREEVSATLVSHDGVLTLPTLAKDQAADHLLAWIAGRFGSLLLEDVRQPVAVKR